MFDRHGGNAIVRAPRRVGVPGSLNGKQAGVESNPLARAARPSVASWSASDRALPLATRQALPTRAAAPLSGDRPEGHGQWSSFKHRCYPPSKDCLDIP